MIKIEGYTKWGFFIRAVSLGFEAQYDVSMWDRRWKKEKQMKKTSTKSRIQLHELI
jgi:hypothetical protein